MKPKNVFPLLALSLCLAGCTKWDKEATAPAAATPPPAEAAAAAPAANIPKAYTETWCATTTTLPPEIHATLKQIRESVLKASPPTASFTDLASECNWIAEEIHSSGELDLSTAAMAPVEIDLRPLAVFTSLHKLDLSGQNLRSENLLAIKPMPSLETLDISRNPLLASALDEIVSLFPNLKNLTMAECGLTEIVNLRFDGLLKLYSLSLHGNQLTGTPFSLPRDLGKLDLSTNKIQSASDVLVSHLNSLRVLDLSQNDLNEVPRLPIDLQVLVVTENLRLLNEGAMVTVKRQKQAGQLQGLTPILMGKKGDDMSVKAVESLNKLGLGITFKVEEK